MNQQLQQAHLEFIQCSRSAKRLLEIALDAYKAEDSGLISTPERRDLVLGLISEADGEVAKALKVIEERIKANA